MKDFWKYLHCLLIGTVFILGPASDAGSDPGPLTSANRFPLHMLVLTPRPVSAQVPANGDLEATVAVEYGSVFFDYRNARWQFLIDMEFFVADVSLTYGLFDAVSIRADIPLMSMRDGFLDGFLQNYHDALGVSNYGRQDRPEDTFAYRVTKDGADWIQARSDTLRFGDTRLSMQVEMPPALVGGGVLRSAALITIKLPTGDSRAAMGSGEVDAGFYVPMQWHAGRWSLFFMPGAAWISDPQTLGASVSARNSVSIFTGAALQYNRRWRWLVQTSYYTSPFEQTGIDALDNGAFELAVGFQRRLDNARTLELVFSEDLTRPLPDFNLRLGLTWRFGAGRDGRDEQ